MKKRENYESVTLMNLFVNSRYINWHCNFPLIFCIEFTLVHWCFHTLYGFCCPLITLGNRYCENKSLSPWWLVKLRPSPARCCMEQQQTSMTLMINTTLSKRKRFLYSDLLHPNLFSFFLRSSRVCQLWHYRHLRLDNSQLYGFVLCIVECSAISVASIYLLNARLCNYDNQKYLRYCHVSPGETKTPLD